MNTKLLNTINLDDGKVIIKKGSGGGGVTINNQNKSVEITENGTTEVTADNGYTGLGKVTINTNVASSGGGSGWTGHADADGLRAIGWTEEDIAYYQENGVNWNEEDDEYHKVTDDNKALYGVLTAGNISEYKVRIVYLPKIDMGSNVSYTLSGLWYLVGIPKLNLSSRRILNNFFSGCYSLVCCPAIETDEVSSINSMFNSCRSLTSVAPLNIKSVNHADSVLTWCMNLKNIKLSNLKIDLDLTRVPNISKESLLYMINNESAQSPISITLDYHAYNRLAEDADIVAALANHPNISLASA